MPPTLPSSCSPLERRTLLWLAPFQRGLPPFLVSPFLKSVHATRATLHALVTRGLVEIDVLLGFKLKASVRDELLAQRKPREREQSLVTHARLCLDHGEAFDSERLAAELDAVIGSGTAPGASPKVVRVAMEAALLCEAEPKVITTLLAQAPKGSQSLAIKLLVLRGLRKSLSGNLRSAKRDLGEALSACRDAESAAEVNIDLGLLYQHERRFHRAMACYEAALARKGLSPLIQGRALCNIGAVMHDLVRLEEARAHYERALSLVAGNTRLEGVTLVNLAVLTQEEGNLETAIRTYERAIFLLQQFPRLGALARTNLGAAFHELGRLEAAHDCHIAALHALEQAGDVRSAALCRLRLALAGTALGRSDAVLLDLGSSPLMKNDEVFQAFHALARAYADVMGRGVDRKGAFARAHRAIHNARMQSIRGGTPIAHSDDVRFAVRLVESALRADAAPMLVMKPDAQAFRAPGEEWTSLERHPACRRLLLRLVAQHSTRGFATLETLWSAGWPGEQAVHGAWQNRVHVALSYLRQHGLRRWIHRDEKGYSLDPELHVEI